MHFFLLLFTLLCFSCNSKKIKEPVRIAQRDTIVVKDTVWVVLKQTILEKNETTFVSKKVNIPAKEREPKTILPLVEKRKEIAPEKAVQKYAEPKDTQFFYYKNSKAVSVKITPWKEERQHTILFDPFGNETYKMEAVRSSYQVSVNLKFQPNGAVEKANIHTNPGASMYWYETEITFGINNEPEWKNTERQPVERLDIRKPEYWDKKTKQWKKQEVME